jgi:hypothetical protein
MLSIPVWFPFLSGSLSGLPASPDHGIGAFAAPTGTIEVARKATCAAFVLFFTHGIASKLSGLTD